MHLERRSKFIFSIGNSHENEREIISIQLNLFPRYFFFSFVMMMIELMILIVNIQYKLTCINTDWFLSKQMASNEHICPINIRYSTLFLFFLLIFIRLVRILAQFHAWPYCSLSTSNHANFKCEICHRKQDKNRKHLIVVCWSATEHWTITFIQNANVERLWLGDHLQHAIDHDSGACQCPRYVLF